MNKVRKAFPGNSKGVGLIEVVIALAILGIVAVAFLGGLATALNATRIADERSVAQTLAQSQMEYIKNCEYESGASPSYEQLDVSSPDNPGYTISVDAPPIDSDTGDPLDNPGDDMGIQKITITIKHHSNEVLTLEDYKVDR
jgi:prepilin-type N-terminal cleavage/methylation domain-containing protein